VKFKLQAMEKLMLSNRYTGKRGPASLQMRLFLRFMLISTVSIVILGISAAIISNNILFGMAKNYSIQMVENAANELDMLFYDTFYMYKLSQNSPFIQNALSTDFETVSDRYASDLKISSELFLIAEYKKDIYGIYIIGANGGLYKSHYQKFKNEELNNESWFDQIMGSNELYYTGMGVSKIVDSKSNEVMSFGMPIIDKRTGDATGVFIVELDKKTIEKKIGTTLGQMGYILIVDSQNNIISAPVSVEQESNIMFDMLPKNPIITIDELVDKMSVTISRYDDEETQIINDAPLIVYKELSSNGFKVIGVIPKTELNKEGRMIALVVAIIVVLLSITAMLISWRVSRNIVNPINKLTKLMGKVENGNLNISIPISSQDEIGQLENGFNIMVSTINELMGRVYKEHEELRKAELRLLQAQINPHFLYNTIDSIIWLSRNELKDDVTKMAVALSSMFRISISKGKDIILLEEEMKHAESYLVIQKIRYNEKFDYNIHIDDDVKRCKVIKLIIQPLIENAIYHGIKLKNGQGKITISARSHNKNLIIEVTDTGLGMNTSVLNKLNDTLKSRVKINDSYGTRNVNERIKIFFGDEYGLQYYSEFDIFTTAEITLPIIMEDE
jgi:two-component system, sensor histidine kinase YesM